MSEENNKFEQVLAKIYGFVDKLIGLVVDRPWDVWLKFVNRYVVMFLPVAIATAGILAFVAGIIFCIDVDARFSVVIAQHARLLPALFAILIAPIALRLVGSLMEKGDQVVIRPELLNIMKIAFGLGGALISLCMFLSFDAGTAVGGFVVIGVSLLMIVALGRPEIVNAASGYPKNVVEEVISIVMFFIRIVLALMPIIVGLVAVGGIAYGIITWITEDFLAARQAAEIFLTTSFMPMAIPLGVYFSYIFAVFFLDFYRAIVSIPAKLEELKK